MQENGESVQYRLQGFIVINYTINSIMVVEQSMMHAHVHIGSPW